jgi:hypothetical protein
MTSIETAWQDVRRGVRVLVRTPGFSLATILTLTLGIGATTAIFTVVNAVLLADLPYQEPDRRVMIWSRWISFDKTWLSEAEVLDYRRLCKTLSDVAAWGTGQVNLTGDGDPVRVTSAAVTANTAFWARSHSSVAPLHLKRTPPVRIASSCSRTGCGRAGTAANRTRSADRCISMGARCRSWA